MLKQMPSGTDSTKIEMNLALQLGMNEFRYGSRQTEIVHHLGQMKPDDLRKNIVGLLGQGEWTVVTLSPGSGQK